MTILTTMLASFPVGAQSIAPELARKLDTETARVLPQVVGWRRDIHQHPELSNRELRTAKLVIDQLLRLGLDVRPGVAHTGVVAVLHGGKPGAVVALRADMDALPVKEQGDLPFKSKVRALYRGEQVDVMHACGHDNHVAILLGVAEVLTRVKSEIPGTVKFLFQPAEEGAPPGEEGGAALMIKEGALSAPAPGAIFGLHVWTAPVGTISYRPGPTLSASDKLTITVKGKQTHAAFPWNGIDPIVVGAQIVVGLQTIPSRQLDISRVPSLISIGSIHAGNRANIIPELLVMEGTVRTFDEAIRMDIKERIRRTADFIARSAGASAEVVFEPQTPVAINDPALTDQMLPSLRRVAGAENVQLGDLHMPTEDFAFYQQHIPGMFIFLGIVPKGSDPAQAPRNHSPAFFADEAALPLGVRVLANLALDWLVAQPPPIK